MADVVIVRDANRRAIANDIAVLQAKLNPAGGVLGVPVVLVATEKQQVGVEPPEIPDDLITRPGRATGVARKVCHHNLVAVYGITTDEPFEFRLLAVAHPVLHVIGVVPVFNPKMSVPSRIMHFRPGRHTPFFLTGQHEFQSCLALFAGLEGEELCRELEHAALMGVHRERHHLIPRHVHARWRTLASPGGRLAIVARALPPLTGGERLEVGKALSE